MGFAFAAVITLAMPALSFASLGPIQVPEPSTTALFLAGGAIAAALRRRRKQ